MGDGDGTAILNLLAEAWDNRTVGAEDIAETGGDELGLALDFALRHCKAEALDVNLGKALATAHNVGRIHGFVGGYHHHHLNSVLDTFVGYHTGTVDIGEDGFARVLFHKRNVLVGSCVEDYLRLPVTEGIVQTVFVADASDDGHEVGLREAGSSSRRRLCIGVSALS